MLGKVLTALLAMTAVLCCSANMDFANITAEDIQKLKEIWSNRRCNVTTNTAEDVIITHDCIKTVNGKEIVITEENLHDPTTYLGSNITKTEWEAVHSCSYKKRGYDKEWRIEEAKDFIAKNMTFTDEATRGEFEKRIEACVGENKSKEEAAACYKETFFNVCFNTTLPKDSPK